MQLGGLPVGFGGFAPAAGCWLLVAWLSLDVDESVALRSLESGCLSRAAPQHFTSAPVKGGKGNETYLCLFLVIVWFCLFM